MGHARKGVTQFPSLPRPPALRNDAANNDMVGNGAHVIPVITRGVLKLRNPGLELTWRIK